MACTQQTLSAIAKNCTNNKGGVFTVYVRHWGDIATKTVVDGKISTITLASGADAQAVQWEFNKETASLVSTMTKEESSGSLFWTNVLSLKFAKADTTKRLALTAATKSDVCVMVKDNNGNVWFMGFDEPVSATTGELNSGTSYTDGSSLSLTLQDVSDDTCYEMSDSAVATFIGTAPVGNGGE